jgi:hypothetical protein
VVFVVTLTFAGLTVASGQSPFFSQETFPRGQNIAPAFEGWEENPDGTFNMGCLRRSLLIGRPQMFGEPEVYRPGTLER